MASQSWQKFVLLFCSNNVYCSIIFANRIEGKKIKKNTMK
jgi:hypothetical protein